MKKSAVIYLHLIVWIALIASKFTAPITTHILSVQDYGDLMIVVQLLTPVFFYLGYFLILNIKWKRSTIFMALLGLIVVYTTLYFSSRQIFAMALAPLSSALTWMLMGSLFRFFIDWFRKKNAVANLKKENAESNLALLSNQINPHFLFNTLHNIDAQIHDQPNKASESLVKLSDIMRYMLGDARADKVALQKEIDYIESYLELEGIRLKNPTFLNYQLTGDAEAKQIAPMVLIPFIENAFKHSVDSDRENGITIRMDIQDSYLHFHCKNDFDPNEAEKDSTPGIGLDTVKKRLDLIYPGKHKLSINPFNAVFEVQLELDLYEN